MKHTHIHTKHTTNKVRERQKSKTIPFSEKQKRNNMQKKNVLSQHNNSKQTLVRARTVRERESNQQLKTKSFVVQYLKRKQKKNIKNCENGVRSQKGKK